MKRAAVRTSKPAKPAPAWRAHAARPPADSFADSFADSSADPFADRVSEDIYDADAEHAEVEDIQYRIDHDLT